MRRPAETTAAGAGAGALIVAIAAHNTLAALTAAVGLVPGVVTYLTLNGGLSGVARRVWRGGQR